MRYLHGTDKKLSHPRYLLYKKRGWHQLDLHQNQHVSLSFLGPTGVTKGNGHECYISTEQKKIQSQTHNQSGKCVCAGVGYEFKNMDGGLKNKIPFLGQLGCIENYSKCLEGHKYLRPVPFLNI